MLLISRLCYRFGFTIQIHRISVRDFGEIKAVLIQFKLIDDIKLYSDFLNKYTGINYERIRFIGSGGGMGTTQTHTILKKKDEFFFEKIFDVRSQEFQNIKMNYNYIKDELEKRAIKIPRLVNIFETEILGVCQFTYIPNLEDLESDDLIYKMGLLKKLWEVPNRPSFNGGDYQELTIVKTRLINLLFHLLNKPTMSQFLNIKQYVDHQKKVLTHCDFYKRNIFKNYLIDWDEAGFYPFGLDVANVLCDGISEINELSVQGIFKILADFNIAKSEQISIVYFFIIFSAYKVNNDLTEIFIEDLHTETIENS